MTANARLAGGTASALLCLWSVFTLTRTSYVTGPISVAVIALLLAGVAARAGRLHLPRPPILAYTGLAWASLAWTEIPNATFDDAVLLTASVLSGAAVAATVTPEAFIRLGDIALRIAVLGSLALGLVAPELGLQQGGPTDGTLIGLYPTRNVLGYVVVMATVFLVLAGRRPPVFTFFFSLYVLTLFWTGSRTSLLAFCIAVAVAAVVIQLKRSGRSARWAGLTLAVPGIAVGVIVALGERAGIAGLLGRDLSFSGRADIWRTTLELAEQKPYFGWGYGSPFESGGFTGYVFGANLGWLPPGAHNGFLTIYLELGFAGVVLAGWALLSVALAAIRVMSAETVPSVAPFAVVVIAVLLCVDLMETRMFVAIGAFLISYIGVALNERYTEVTAIPGEDQVSGESAHKSSRVARGRPRLFRATTEIEWLNANT